MKIKISTKSQSIDLVPAVGTTVVFVEVTMLLAQPAARGDKLVGQLSKESLGAKLVGDKGSLSQ